MTLDPVILSRIQFGFVISFHIIFPAFTIGLSAFIATLLILWRRTGQEHFHRLARQRGQHLVAGDEEAEVVRRDGKPWRGCSDRSPT